MSLSEPMDRRCKARSTRSKEQCKKWAMKGKDVCRKHGGATPIKHGLYSKYVTGTLGDMIREAADDPDLLNLERVIQVQQALLTQGMKAHQDGKLEPEPRYDDEGNEIPYDAARVDPFQLEALRKLSEAVSKSIVAHSRIKESGDMVPIAVVGILIDKFVDAVNRHVQDDVAKRGIMDVLAKVEMMPVAVGTH